MTMIAYQNEENYTLAVPDWTNLNPSNLQEHINSLSESIEDFPCLILHGGQLESLTESAETLVDFCKDTIARHNGIFIVAELPEEIAARLTEKEITCVPAIDEAIDFIFMEQIEKSLDEEEE